MKTLKIQPLSVQLKNFKLAYKNSCDLHSKQIERCTRLESENSAGRMELVRLNKGILDSGRVIAELMATQKVLTGSLAAAQAKINELQQTQSKNEEKVSFAKY